MSPLAWGAVAVVALALELGTVVFVALFVALGALGAATAAAAGAGTAAQVAVFAAVALAGLALARRPLMRSVCATPLRRPDGGRGLVGRRGHVTRDVRADEPGTVRVGDESWTALPFAGVAAHLPAGAAVEVLAVEGVALLVHPVDEREGRDAARLDG